MSDPRWTDETEQLVLRAFTDTYDTRAALALTIRPVLTALADAGLLVTPQMRQVVEAARAYDAEHGAFLRMLLTAEPEMAKEPRFRLVAAVDTYEASQEERQ